jgi:hypothetical protein
LRRVMLKPPQPYLDELYRKISRKVEGWQWEVRSVREHPRTSAAEVIQVLSELAGDAQTLPGLRMDGVVALGHCASVSAEAVTTLIKLLGDADLRIQDLAARQLAEASGTEITARLVQAIQAAEAEPALRAAWALGERVLGGEQVTEGQVDVLQRRFAQEQDLTLRCLLARCLSGATRDAGPCASLAQQVYREGSSQQMIFLLEGLRKAKSVPAEVVELVKKLEVHPNILLEEAARAFLAQHGSS